MKELNKYLVKREIFIAITSIILFVVVVVIGALLDNIYIAILLGIILFTLIFIGLDKYKEYLKNKKKEKFKNKMKELKLKENITTYENLYLNAYNDMAIDILIKVFKNNNYKHINEIDFFVSDEEDYITFDFKYRKYGIYNKVYLDKIVSKTDLIEEKELAISINDYNSIEAYFVAILPIVSENILLIEEQKEIKQEQTLKEIEEYIDYAKSQTTIMCILLLVCSIPFSFITYLGFKELIFSVNDIGSYVIMIPILSLLPGLMILGFIYCIHNLIDFKTVKKDLENNNISTIKGVPYKARIVKITVGVKYPFIYTYGAGVILKFKQDNKKVKLLFVHRFNEPNRHQKKEIIEEILKKEYEVSYLSKSRYIVSDIKEIRRIVKRKTR